MIAPVAGGWVVRRRTFASVIAWLTFAEQPRDGTPGAKCPLDEIGLANFDSAFSMDGLSILVFFYASEIYTLITLKILPGSFDNKEQFF